MAGVPRAQISAVAEEVHSLMKPLLDEKGINLRFRYPSSPYYGLNLKLDSRTNRVGDYIIEVNRGFYNNHFMTKEIFLHSVCHELGHLLGGAPFIASKTFEPLPPHYQNLSTEGQADFFSTSVCVKKALANKLVTLKDTPPEGIQKRCSDAYANEIDYQTCLYSAVTSEALARAYHFINKVNGRPVSPLEPSLKKISTRVAHETIHIIGQYPSTQCRLDTMVNGALCENNPSDFSCKNKEGEVVEMRPRCWFNPNDQEVLISKRSRGEANPNDYSKSLASKIFKLH